MQRLMFIPCTALLLACGGGGGGNDADDEDVGGEADVVDEEVAGDPQEDVEEEEGPTVGGLGDPCAMPSDCEGDICITDFLFPGFEGGY